MLAWLLQHNVKQNEWRGDGQRQDGEVVRGLLNRGVAGGDVKGVPTEAVPRSRRLCHRHPSSPPRGGRPPCRRSRCFLAGWRTRSPRLASLEEGTLAWIPSCLGRVLCVCVERERGAWFFKKKAARCISAITGRVLENGDGTAVCVYRSMVGLAVGGLQAIKQAMSLTGRGGKPL